MEREYYLKNDNVLIWRPRDILNVGKIQEFIKFIDAETEMHGHSLPRFIDLTKIEGIFVSYKEVYAIAKQRTMYYKAAGAEKVKIAFLINNPLTFGMTRMYQMFNDEAYTDMYIFEKIEDVSEFLRIDIPALNDMNTSKDN